DGDAGGGRRPARAAGEVRDRGDLEEAGGAQACRRQRPDGAAGRGDAGMRTLVWNQLDAKARAAALRRPAQVEAATTARAVQALLREVRSGGEEALRSLGRRFDGADPGQLEVPREEFAAAEAATSPALRLAINEAATRIERFHRAGMREDVAVEAAPGVRCERVLRPIRRVGLYVPAGSAPLPSTALMLAIPARLAGCPEVVLCTPPRADGTADPAVLVAAA